MPDLTHYYSRLTLAEKAELATLARAAVAEYEYASRAIAEDRGIPLATAYSWIRHLENEGYLQPGEAVKRRRPRERRHYNGDHPEPVGPPVVTVGEPFVLVLPSGERLEMLMVEAVTAEVVD